MSDETISAPDALALVLSGGSARAMFQAGVCEALMKHPEFKRATVFSGSSAGAINAAFLASGRTPDDMRAFWMGCSREPPVRTRDAVFSSLARGVGGITASALWRWLRDPRAWDDLRDRARDGGSWTGALLSRLVDEEITRRYGDVQKLLEGVASDHLFDTDRMRKRLRDVFGETVRVKPGYELAVSVVDVARGEAVRWVTRAPSNARRDVYVVEREIPVEVLVASAAIPVVFPAVTLRDRAYWDGGLLVNTPLAPAVALDAAAIVPVLTAPASTNTEGPAPAPATLGESLGRLADTVLENTYNVDRALLLTRNVLAREGYREARDEAPFHSVTLFKALRPSAGIGDYLDFRRNTLERAWTDGVDVATAWLALPDEDRIDRRVELSDSAPTLGD